MWILQNIAALTSSLAFANRLAAREVGTMSFAKVLDNLPLERSTIVRGFEQLIAPKSDTELERMAQTSRSLTLQNFGRTMRLFAPLYASTPGA